MDTQQEDFQNLSITDRLQHKVWKARQSAYTELYDLFKTTVDELIFAQYEGYLKNIATDVNAVAQEVGLNTIYEYVNNAPNASRTGDTVVPALIAKCLGAPKAGTKQKATDIILLYAEVDVADPIVELVLPGIQAKQPKLVAQTVVVLRELIRQFGAKTVNPKPLIKILPKLFGHIDKNVRAEAFTLTVEIYKWIGPALSPSLSELKPVQVKELEEAFGKLPLERPSPSRLLRSEQQKTMEAAAVEVEIGGAHDAAADEDRMVEEPVDLYDLADPVDITAKLPGHFYELLASKKWQERREALDILLASAKAPKITDMDYSELISALAKRINDANILLVGVTANCIEAMANGLRTNFGKYKELVVPPLIEKLKERKPAILEHLANALHSIFSHMSITDIADAIAIAVKHKNPQIRTQSVKLVTRQLRIIHKMPSKLEIKALAELMLKTSDDGDGSAREASAEGLGTLMNMVGEQPMLAYMNSLDDIKRNKIKEFCDKAQTKAKLTVIKKPVAPSMKSVTGLKKINKPLKSLPLKSESMMIDDVAAPAIPIPRNTALKRRLSTTSTNATNTQNKKPTLSTPRPKVSTATSTTARTPKKATTLLPAHEPQEVKFKYSPEDAEARVTEYIPLQVWEDIGSSQWKVRLSAMDSLYVHLGSAVEPSNIEAEIVIRCLSKKPGWKEMNFQVMIKFYNVMQLLATNCPSFSRSCAALGIPGIVEKLGDLKLKTPAGECLVSFAEATSLQFVLSQSYPIWKKAKSPKIVTDALVWMHQALLDFGIVGVQVHDLIDFVKNALTNTNPGVRSKAVTVLGALRMYLGPDIITFVQDISPALMTTVEKEFEKVSKMCPPQPTKMSAARKAKALTSETGTSNSLDDGMAVDNLDSLIPRTDIAAQLGQAAPDCGDINWKKRKEGLGQVIAIIEGANKRIKPNLGDFPGVLRQRLSDSNKILQIQAVEITGLLVLSMGKPFEKYVKFLSGGITSVLADNKASVRNAGVTLLDIIRNTCGLEGLIGAFGNGLTSDSPILRKELLTWLLKSMNEQDVPRAAVDYSPLISPLLSCLQDRNGDVRKAAHTLLPLVGMSTGFEKVMRKVSELNNTQRQTVMPFVESIRGTIPAAPTRTTSPIASLTAKAKRLSTSATSAPPIAAADIFHTNVTMTTGLENGTSRRVSGSDRRTSSDSWGRNAATPTKRTSMGSSSASPSRNSQSFTSRPQPPPLLTADLRTKHLRGKEEPRWQYDASRTDLMDSLQSTCESHIHPDLWRLMFSSNHNAERDHLNALTQLDECISNPDLSLDKYGLDFDDLKKRYQANSDLLFKYLTIRFLDTGTSILLKCLDLAQHLVGILDSEGALLSEYEAISFIPFLINKIGDQRETTRAKVRSILNAVCTIYPPSKMVNFLLDSAANSKNPKARMECLDEIGTLLQQNGITVMLPNKALPLIATHVGDRDAGVRNAALNTIAQIYLLIGDPVLKYVNRLGEKEKGLVEERLKRIMPLTQSSGDMDGIQHSQRLETDDMDIDDAPPMKRTPRSSAGSTRFQPLSTSLSSNADTKPLNNHHTVSEMDGVLHEYENTATMHVRHSTDQTNHIPSQQRQQPEQQAYTVDYLINQIAHGTDPQENIEALKRLVKYLNTTPEMTLSEIDAMVNAIILQVRVSYSMVDSPDSVPTRLCKHIVSTLVLFFSKNDLASVVSKDSLVSLLEELAGRLLDERILSMESGPQLSKALNVAMVKILENCQPNTTFSALLSILGKCASKLQPNDSSSGKATRYTELVMKCLWKLTKTIQENLRSGKLSPDQLLFDIDQFFLLTPPDEWKRRMRENVPLGELPLRTIKTLLLEIVSGLGDRVFDHLTLIDQPQNSSIYPYLHHMLEACKKKAETHPQQQSSTDYQHQHQRLASTTSNTHIDRQLASSSSSNQYYTNPANSTTHQAASRPSLLDSNPTIQPQPTPIGSPFSPSTYNTATPSSDIDINDTLKRIFEKIGTREKTREGIAELYEFQKKHPSAESKVNGYLSKTGSYFQRYIQRGLSSLAENDQPLK